MPDLTQRQTQWASILAEATDYLLDLLASIADQVETSADVEAFRQTVLAARSARAARTPPPTITP